MSAKHSFAGFANLLTEDIARWDTGGRYLYLNAAHARTLGTDAESPVGTPIPDSLSNIKAAVARVAATGEPALGVQQTVTSDDGSVVVFDVNLVPERDRQGKIASIIGVGRDVTRSYRDQEVIVAQQQELRNLIESSPDCVISYDREGRISYLSGSLVEELGFKSAEEAIGKRPSEAWPDGRFDDIERSAAQVVESGTGVTLETKGRDAQESTLFHEIHILPKRDARGNIVGTIAFGRDATERKETEKRLLILSAAMDRLSDTVLLMNDNFHFIYANESACKNLGYSHEELATMSPLDIDPDLDGDSLREMSSDHSETTHYPDFERRHRAKDGRVYPVEISVCRVVYDGAPYDLTLSREISERKLLQSEIERREREFRSLAESTPDSIARHTPEGRIVYANPSFEKNLGALIADPISKNEAEGASEALQEYLHRLRDVGTAGEPDEMEMSVPLADGNVWSCHVRFVAERDGKGNIVSVLAIGRDITERKKMEDELRQHQQRLVEIAYHDALTGLPNRMLLADRMDRAIAQTKRSGGLLVVVYVDLDDFKPINDLHGHEAGDEVLIEISKRMLKSLREGDTVARIGGDEFVILLSGIQNVGDAFGPIRRLLDGIQAPLTFDGNELMLSASVGASVYPKDGEDPDHLIRNADQAMLRAKRMGRNQFVYFEEEHP